MSQNIRHVFRKAPKIYLCQKCTYEKYVKYSGDGLYFWFLLNCFFGNDEQLQMSFITISQW